MLKNPLGKESSKNPEYTGRFKETGTPTSGYSDRGPFRCEDCIHRIGGQKSDLPFCVHPAVLKDSELKKSRIVYKQQKAVEIDMERGCCRFVNQPLEKDED